MNKYEMMDLTENEQIRDDGFNWKINKYEMMDLTDGPLLITRNNSKVAIKHLKDATH